MCFYFRLCVRVLNHNDSGGWPNGRRPGRLKRRGHTGHGHDTLCRFLLVTRYTPHTSARVRIMPFALFTSDNACCRTRCARTGGLSAWYGRYGRYDVTFTYSSWPTSGYRTRNSTQYPICSSGILRLDIWFDCSRKLDLGLVDTTRVSHAHSVRILLSAHLIESNIALDVVCFLLGLRVVPVSNETSPLTRYIRTAHQATSLTTVFPPIDAS